MITDPFIARTVRELRMHLEPLRENGAKVAFVPTMGALHAGHQALMARAAELADICVVSIFVNPTQFGAGEDFAKYPRTWESDFARCAQAGVAVIFAPNEEVVYGGKKQVSVKVGSLADGFEGADRPGHFDGVATVVAKLFNMVQPDVAIFGEKDAQQLAIVRAMVRSLDFTVAIESLATVRESDGLAMSSRNRYLSDSERSSARVIPQSLEAAKANADRGLRAVVAAVHAEFETEPTVGVSYIAVVDPQTFVEVGADHHGEALLLIAASVGSTRLIDNTLLDLHAPAVTVMT